MINYHEKLLKDSIEANMRYLLHAEMNESEIRECTEKIRQYTEALDNITSSSRIIRRSFKDWMQDVTNIDSEQRFMLTDNDELWEWHEWYEQGLSASDAVMLNAKTYG